MTTELRQKNRRTLLWLVALVVGMFAFAFALVPLYELICRVTGVQSVAVRSEVQQQSTLSLRVADGGEAAVPRPLTVKLDVSVHPSLPWSMQLAQSSTLTVQAGEVYEVVFTATNHSDKEISAQAIPSVTPWQANAYFNKLECFCFNRQTLEGGGEIQMPLRFVVSPKLPDGIHSITLSYNVMRVEAES